MGVCRSCGLTLHVSGMAPTVSGGILTLGQALSLLPGPLSANHKETPLMKPGYATPRFLLSTSLFPGEELAFVACLPTVFSRWLGAIRYYLLLP